MEMSLYQWVSLALVAAGFIGTWVFGAFRLGRAVEQIGNDIRQEIASEKKELISKIERLDERFSEEQRMQDHNFGEVGAAMRQYIADVEKKVREVEIWGRDHFVQKTDFEKAIDTIRQDIREMGRDLKVDFKNLNDKIENRN